MANLSYRPVSRRKPSGGSANIRLNAEISSRHRYRLFILLLPISCSIIPGAPKLANSGYSASHSGLPGPCKAAPIRPNCSFNSGSSTPKWMHR
ncbi:hypothetical protein D3C75_1028140 [compost metagenome]